MTRTKQIATSEHGIRVDPKTLRPGDFVRYWEDGQRVGLVGEVGRVWVVILPAPVSRVKVKRIHCTMIVETLPATKTQTQERLKLLREQGAQWGFASTAAKRILRKVGGAVARRRWRDSGERGQG